MRCIVLAKEAGALVNPCVVTLKQNCCPRLGQKNAVFSWEFFSIGN